MTFGIYRPSRIRNGKSVRSKWYRLVYRLDGMPAKTWVSLRTSDKQVAQKKAAEFLRERERELNGLAAPRAVREAAAKSLQYQLSEFATDLSARGRRAMYVYNVERRVLALIKWCGWERVEQISADSFQRWRSAHASKAPKTLNDYHDALRGFLKWLVRSGRLARNSMEGVPKAQTLGRERRIRRALKADELNRLIQVSGSRRVGYLLAALTGLRRNEIKNLRWGDVMLSAKPPFIAVRSAISKNAKRAEIPLHPQLVKLLCEVRPNEVKDSEPVVRIGELASMWMLRKDFEAANIPLLDGLGRRADFHALRETFNTLMALGSVDLQTRRLAMRHSDIRLTSSTYLDGSLLPLMGAINALPWFGESAPVDAPRSDTNSHVPSLVVTNREEGSRKDLPVNQLDEHEFAPAGMTGRRGEPGCLARIRT